MKRINRLLSILLVLCVLVGLCPIPSVGAALTSEQQLTSQELKTRIGDIAEAARHSKYVQYEIPTTTENGKTVIVGPKDVLTGMHGHNFILVGSAFSVNGARYAFDPSVSPSYCQYGLDQVVIEGKQLFNVNPDAAIRFQYDENSNNEPLNDGNAVNWRAGFYLWTKNNRHLYIPNAETTTGNANQLSMEKESAGKPSITLFVRAAGTFSIYNSGVFNPDQRTAFQFFSEPSLYAGSRYTGEDAGGTSLLMFQEMEKRVNTEPLYDAIMEAEAYLLNYNLSEEDKYDAFLSALDTAISTYHAYNLDEYTGDVAAAEAEVMEKAETLTLATYVLKSYADQLANLPIPTTMQLKTTDAISNGTYFVLGWDMNGYYRAMNHASPSTQVGGGFTWDVYQIAPISVKDGTVRANNLNRAVTILKAKDADAPYKYSMMFSNGNFLSMDKHDAADNLQALDGAKQAGLHVSAAPQLLEIQKHANSETNAADAFYIGGKEVNDTFYLNYGDETNAFRSWRLTAGVGAPISYDMFLYQVSPLTVELYRSLVYVKQYVDNSNGLYDGTQFALFMEDFREARDLYLENMDEFEDTTKQAQLDTLAAKLKAWPEKLTITSPAAQYVDIPMEILDFRSDKFLMEFYDLYYRLTDSLSTDSPNYQTFVNSTEEVNALNRDGEAAVGVRQNMTLPTLVDGQLIYTKETVGYVAGRIVTDDTSDMNTGDTAKKETFYDSLNGTAYNSVFETMIKNFYTEYTGKNNKTVLGSWDDTVSKLQPGTDDVKANGDILLFKDVKTAYDLAYYGLNNLWRAVGSNDSIISGTELYYNTVVPQRNTMRMYADEKGMYTIDSYKRIAYNGDYCFNTQPFVSQTSSFMPINQLGFETPVDGQRVETDPSYYAVNSLGRNTTLEDRNYNFTLHAYGSFVYYEGQKQMFDFRGDDDVYFFIDGKKVMDIGGTHNAAGFTLDLNKANEELKLGLVDGEIYSFDMFYAERHTYASNLCFSTNIKIVNTETLTTKGQYAVNVGGVDSIDPNTGKGAPMADNATLHIGDIVAYSFDMVNYREDPVVNVEMEDPTLGVSLTPTFISTYEGQVDGETVISLTNPDADHANGVVTRFDNLLLEYRTLGEGDVAVSQPVQNLSAEEMLDLFVQANDQPEDAQNRIFSGCYRVRVDNAKDLRDLLAAGIPMKCSFSLYGFLRKTKATDTPYINELTTHCSYPSSTHMDATYTTVTGKASRMVRILEHSSMPQVRRLDVVLDYGKAVSIPLEDIEDLIRFEDGSPVKIGSVVGFLSDGYNGELLKKRPDDLFCTETGGEKPAAQGTYRLVGDNLVYEPNQFLTQIDTIYGVVEVEDFYYGTQTTEEFRYILVELRLTPAHVMYYETDFAPDIFTLTQVGEGEGWKTNETDGTSAQDPYQDYERLNGTVYHTDIDREYIPAEAFFVDFDGEGYERRYRDNPQYGGNDFDKADAWYSHHGRSSNYNKHTLNAAAGTMELTNILNTGADGKPLGAWIQTIISGGDIGDNALRLNAGKGYYAQIRFRVENCDSYGNEGSISLFFSNSKDAEENDEGDVAKDDRRVRLPLVHEEVLKGDYMTVKIPLDGTYFSRSDEIDIVRLYIAGYTGVYDKNPDAKITIDYIYIGPEMGMENDIYGNYLFVGFDDTDADHLRYSSSVYGAYTSGKTYRDLDNKSAWVSSSADSSSTVQILKGLENDPENGYIYFEDRVDDAKIEKGTKNYCFIHAGTNKTPADENNPYLLPINYTPTDNDFCQIRIKIENGKKVPDEPNKKIVLGIGIEYATGLICGKADIDESYIDTGFHTITFPLDAPSFRRMEGKLQWLHPVVYNILGKDGSTTGAKFTIDYIFIGPEHLLDRVSQHVNPVTQKVNHLFFDFTNDDAAKVRYSEPAYGTSGINYDVIGTTGWKPGGAAGSSTITNTNGAITFRYPGTAGDAGPYISTDTLNFTPGKQDYARFRVKFDKTESSVSLPETFDLTLNSRLPKNSEGKKVSINLWTQTYRTEDYVNDGKYHIFTVPLMESENYKSLGNHLYELLFKVDNLKGCSITLDWLYVGPLTKGNPSAPSLYFGFGDRGSGHWNTDRLRYDSDTYGFMNYDTHTWLSESPAVPSSLTGRIYGWNYAGNERIDYSSDPLCPKPLPEESITYPEIGVTTQPNTGHLELSIKNGIQGPIGIQTHPNAAFNFIYWRYYMQKLNYHPAEENIVQVRFKTENLTIGEDFAVKLMYVPAGLNAFCTSAPLKLAPLMPLNPEEDYVIMTAVLDDTFNNAPAIERLRLVFEGVSADNGAGKILVDYVYAGVGTMAPEPVYGYDSSYENDTHLSNGSSAFVKGNGVKIANGTNTAYTEATFEFKGTGFDIISRTGHEQATIRVEVQNKATGVVEKRLTVNNKGELELYQIPVVSVQGLPYGEYTVTLWVNKAVESDYEILDRGADFYFDAVRIYDPMNVEQETLPEGERIAQIAYETDREAYNYIKEIRNILLTETEFDNLSGETKGAVFIDLKDNSFTAPTENGGNMQSSDLLIDNYTTMDIQTYNKVGPKNEVYLAPNQAVAFRIEVDTLQDIASLDIGAKTIVGSTVAMEAGIVVKTENGYEIESRDTFTVGSSTALYRALTTSNIKKLTQDGTTTVYLVIFNNTKTANDVSTPATAPVNVLSLTDVKVAYKAHPDTAMEDGITDPEIKPTETEATSENTDGGDEKSASKSSTAVEPVRFLVDGNTASAAAAFLKAVMETPVLAEGKTLMHSLNLESDIAMNYVISKTELEGYDSFYLECEIPVYEGNRKVSTKVVTVDPVEKGKYYYFTLEGLTAVNMNDKIVSRLRMVRGANHYYTEDDVYSIAQYAYAQIDKEGCPDSLKELCANLLRYGSAAQSYKAYRTDSLADSFLTEEAKAYLTDTETVTFGNTNRVLNDCANALIRWQGKALVLESKVCLKFIFSMGTYTGDVSDLTLRVRYADIRGVEKTLTLSNAELYNSKLSYYAFTLDALLAAELRSVVSVQVYSGEAPVSHTLQYSADTYGNNKTGALLDLCKVLFAYSDSAKKYFS